MPGHELDVTALVMVGQHLVSASGDRTARVWRLQSSTALHTLAGHTDMVVDLASCHDGNLASGACKVAFLPNKPTHSLDKSCNCPCYLLLGLFYS